MSSVSCLMEIHWLVPHVCVGLPLVAVSLLCVVLHLTLYGPAQRELLRRYCERVLYRCCITLYYITYVFQVLSLFQISFMFGHFADLAISML